MEYHNKDTTTLRTTKVTLPGTPQERGKSMGRGLGRGQGEVFVVAVDKYKDWL